MGDQQDGRPAFQPLDGVQDSLLVIEIETAGGLIENQQPWLAQQCARQGDALALPVGEEHPPVPHRGIQPLR